MTKVLGQSGASNTMQMLIAMINKKIRFHIWMDNA